jgi:hypothetical protein
MRDFFTLVDTNDAVFVITWIALVSTLGWICSWLDLRGRR